MTEAVSLNQRAASGTWLDHRLTPAEGDAFGRDGYMILDEVLPEAVTDGLEEAFDEVWAGERAARGSPSWTRSTCSTFSARTIGSWTWSTGRSVFRRWWIFWVGTFRSITLT